jgi:hypothetical protein
MRIGGGFDAAFREFLQEGRTSSLRGCERACAGRPEPSSAFTPGSGVAPAALVVATRRAAAGRGAVTDKADELRYKIPGR